jgi:O-antigen/teichoic acid export membrane protein
VPGHRDETDTERLDRNLIELLQEVRVAQTGVQVLFAFLLTVPFTVRSTEITTTQRVVYYATLLLAGAAAMLLIAPTSHHRLLFRCGDKERLVVVANRYAIAGLLAVAGAMVGVVLLVSLLVVGSTGAALAAAAAAAACAWCWYLQPLLRRRALYRTARPPSRAAPPTSARAVAGRPRA